MIDLLAINDGNGNHLFNCPQKAGFYKHGQMLYQVYQRNENLFDIIEIQKKYICSTSVRFHNLTKEEEEKLETIKESEKRDSFVFDCLFQKAVECNLKIKYYRGYYVEKYNDTYSLCNDNYISERVAKNFDLKEVTNEYDFECRFVKGRYCTVTFGNTRNWTLGRNYTDITKAIIAEEKARKWIENNGFLSKEKKDN